VDDLRFDHDLIPVVAQDHITGEIRMVAWANRAAIDATLETGRATFFSRSRAQLWEKGGISGNRLDVVNVLVDCDADTLVYRVRPHGPSCHTGRPTCFFRRLAKTGILEDAVPASSVLARVDEVLASRRTASAEASYVKSLYDGGPFVIGEKVREEATELAEALAVESDERVVSEAADVLFHVMVAVRSRGKGIEDVLGELERREGQSGHDEKKARKE
jgi:phosphoribosyl-AMP cyclohydrolase / phosphoribosyl-ATP pyrophosphohydrolase